MRLLWSQVVEHCTSSNGSARPTEDELEILKPPEGRGEHVHPGPVPPRPRLHADAHVQVLAPEGPVAVVLLVDRVLGHLVRGAGHHVMVIQGVGQTRPLHLDRENDTGDVEQLEVIVLARRPHKHVQGAVHLDDPLLPVELQVGEAEVHLLCSVVRVEAGMEKQLGRLGGQKQAAVKNQTDLVPPGQGWAGVQAVSWKRLS